MSQTGEGSVHPVGHLAKLKKEALEAEETVKKEAEALEKKAKPSEAMKKLAAKKEWVSTSFDKNL